MSESDRDSVGLFNKEELDLQRKKTAGEEIDQFDESFKQFSFNAKNKEKLGISKMMSLTIPK